MSDRIYNFNPGPSTLPLPVLEKARDEMINYRGTGMSEMEMSHRSPEYSEINDTAQALIKELLGLGDDYNVLLLQGGASLQFAMVPMNLLREGESADYVITGSWSKKAFKEVNIVAKGREAASSEANQFRRVPPSSEWDRDANAVYTHLTSNNTIAGTQYHTFPETWPSPLVADMSSDILSHRFDPSPFGLIYAGAQKNLGPSGITVVVIRQDLLDRCRDDLPVILRYATHAGKASLYNTPPTFSVYLMKLVLEWIKEQGGLDGIETKNREKADLLYRAMDENPDYFRCPVEKESRSWMNAVFRLPTEDLEGQFIAEAKEAGLGGLKGHRSVGGVRVSMYNAMPLEGVRAVVDFMREFHRSHG